MSQAATFAPGPRRVNPVAPAAHPRYERRMKTVIILAAALAATVQCAHAQSDWTPAERIETYAVSGTTGIELYRSIGERGPEVGPTRAIALTTYELTWTRDYRPENGGCMLKTARPKLTVVYKLPKPAGKLPAATERLWATFIAGIEKHERVHGDIIVETVREIERQTVGLRVEGDSGCKATRAEVQKRLAPLAANMRRRGGEFDKVEMSNGGNVHQLILALVNG